MAMNGTEQTYRSLCHLLLEGILLEGAVHGMQLSLAVTDAISDEEKERALKEVDEAACAIMDGQKALKWLAALPDELCPHVELTTHEEMAKHAKESYARIGSMSDRLMEAMRRAEAAGKPK